jgi:hypothetical protein
MTQDEIIDMARQAGITIYSGEPWINDDDATDELQRFAKVVADKERNACWKIAYEYTQLMQSHTCLAVADAIRARG